MSEIHNPELREVDVERKLALSATLEASALDFDPRVVAAPYNSYGDFESQVHLYNSTGLSTSYKQNGCYIYNYSLAKEGELTAMALDSKAGRNFADLDAEKIGRSAAKKAVEKINHIKPESKHGPVVLSNAAMTSLLNLTSSYFSAKAVDEKLSPLEGRLGDQLFSKNINIFDDPFFIQGFGCRPFDDEGANSQKTPLIEGGVLKNFLTNSVYAKKMGLKNTANASRSPNSQLGVSRSNLVFSPGTVSQRDLLNSAPATILVDQIKGFAGFNAVSGAFSLEAEGFSYENGERTAALANFVISGNILEMLNQVEAVADDLYIGGLETCFAPSVLVSNLSIAGK